MIVCTKCSRENADDDEFCGGCGEFLEWAGQKITAGPSPEPEAVAPEPQPLAPEPEAVAPEPEVVAPELEAIAREPEAPEAESLIAAPQPVEPRPTQPQPTRPTQPEPVQPQPVQPAPVLPSKPVPQRAEPVPAAAAEPALRPGESPCPACGAGNEPERSFCRRCGVSLAGPPEDAKKPSWWKKLLTKDPKVHAAGDRPMRDKKGKFKP